MARPLSDEKREALLASALAAVASLGVAASTLAIAKGAGVAEGTLFRYFPTKDALLNALYLDLKSDLIASLMDGLPVDAATRVQFRHLWDRYIAWGLSGPHKHAALRQLEVSHKITQATQNASTAMSADLQSVVEKGFTSGVLRPQPVLFLWGVIQAIAGVVLETAGNDGTSIAKTQDLGWETLWAAIGQHET